MVRPTGLPWRGVEKKKYAGEKGPTSRNLYGKVGVICICCGRAYIDVLAHISQKHAKIIPQTKYRCLLHDVSLFKWGVVYLRKRLLKTWLPIRQLQNLKTKEVKDALGRMYENLNGIHVTTLEKSFQTAKRIIRNKEARFSPEATTFVQLGDGCWREFENPVHRHNTLDKELVYQEPVIGEGVLDDVIPPTPT
jgi:hypothetical protein